MYDACARTPSDKEFVADWDRKALGPFLNGSVDKTAYHDVLCAQGYAGELCGQCEDGYGHQDLRCKSCNGAASTRVAYFFTWIYTLALLLLLLLLHRQNFACFRGVADYLQNRLVAMSAKSGLLVDNYLLSRVLGDDLAALRAGCEATTVSEWPSAWLPGCLAGGQVLPASSCLQPALVTLVLLCLQPTRCSCFLACTTTSAAQSPLPAASIPANHLTPAATLPQAPQTPAAPRSSVPSSTPPAPAPASPHPPPPQTPWRATACAHTRWAQPSCRTLRARSTPTSWRTLQRPASLCRAPASSLPAAAA